MVRDTLLEDQRKGNFIRIYPCKDSDIYDQYFTTQRNSNKVVYKYIFGDEIVQTEIPKNFAFSSYNVDRSLAHAQEERLSIKQLKNKTNRSNTNSGVASYEYATVGANVQKPNHFSSTGASNKPKLPEVNKTKQKSAKKATPSSGLIQEPDQNSEKLMITGDDVLIEYVARLMIAM